MISKDHRFIFIHNPKTAGNSIAAFLLPYLSYEVFTNNEIGASFTKEQMAEAEQFVKERTAEGYIRTFPHRFEIRDKIGPKHSSMAQYHAGWHKLPSDYGKIDEYFKFAVHRNAWDRSLSFYLSPWRKLREFNKQEFLECVKSMPTLGQKVSSTGSLRSMGRNDVTYFIDFYDLKKGVDHVCDRVGIDKIENLSRLNVAPLKKKDWKSMYDEEMYNAVLHKHREEIEFFNYEF